MHIIAKVHLRWTELVETRLKHVDEGFASSGACPVTLGNLQDSFGIPNNWPSLYLAWHYDGFPVYQNVDEGLWQGWLPHFHRALRRQKKEPL